ncbi:MAG TPA: hypothetical protein PLR25_25785, partial [Planctomycetaceae bacterium]|nr:hypothetical protein [Planctomycetaceae bacterium]
QQKPGFSKKPGFFPGMPPSAARLGTWHHTAVFLFAHQLQFASEYGYAESETGPPIAAARSGIPPF